MLISYIKTSFSLVLLTFETLFYQKFFSRNSSHFCRIPLFPHDFLTEKNSSQKLKIPHFVRNLLTVEKHWVRLLMDLGKLDWVLQSGTRYGGSVLEPAHFQYSRMAANQRYLWVWSVVSGLCGVAL